MHRRIEMSDAEPLIHDLLGGDPVAGARALQALVALGDRGEEALFDGPLAYPRTMQVRRRWLRYVATRADTVVPRLLERLASDAPTSDRYASALLLAGTDEMRGATDGVYAMLARAFRDDEPADAVWNDYMPTADRFRAWGFAGGDVATLWRWVKGSDYAWEKLRHFAFRAATACFARTGRQGWVIQELITHAEPDQLLPGAHEGPMPHLAVGGQELWAAANDEFLCWCRGDVADEVLRYWATHAHWRVRDFGAQIVASLGFQRTTTPVRQWLQREPERTVRVSLMHALERSEVAAGADALLDHNEQRPGEAGVYLARAAWRASDPARARAALQDLADGTGDNTDCEATVSLARLGHRSRHLDRLLDANHFYGRVCAATAAAQLGEAGQTERLRAMRREASVPFERVVLAVALARLDPPREAAALPRVLAEVAGAEDFERRVDLFLMHRFLQDAVLDGLAAGGDETVAALYAWRAEFQPLEPVPARVDAKQPVRPPQGTSAPPSTRAFDVAAAPSPVADPPGAARALRLFISYSHRDERMRRKLGEHLAPLVDEGRIRIWHDREIEAGADWEGEIDREIAEADIVLLLVSAAFLHSRYCRKELLRALEQRDAGRTRPIPILLRPCDWTSVFSRGTVKAQALPRDDRPVASRSWPNQDAAFAAIVGELRPLIERLAGASPPS